MTQTVEEQQQTARTYNKVQFIGRMGNNPTHGSSQAPVKFSLAVAQKDAPPMWLGVDCWGQIGTDVLANKSMYKGVLVEVCGRLTMNQYQGKRYFNISASSVEIVVL